MNTGNYGPRKKISRAWLEGFVVFTVAGILLGTFVYVLFFGPVGGN